ncbi:UNVERIFIED_CONTAM: hypothetical protein FKN15_026768 [Acipenser sinensis]
MHSVTFDQPQFQATVNEGVTGVIVNLTVEDKDDPTTRGWRAVYSIINGNPGQSFEMNTNAQNNQGMLTVIKPLDYEISAFHTLLIKVENEDPLVPDVAYGPSSTATVQVTVVDVNEGPIFYPDPMRVTRHENIPIGSAVATLNTTDPDTLQHQTVNPHGTTGAEPRRSVFRTQAVASHLQPFPAFPDFMEEERSESAPSVLKQTASLTSLEGADKLGLPSFPPVDSTIAALVKAPLVGGLPKDHACLNPQCRVMETHLKRVCAVEAEVTGLANTASRAAGKLYRLRWVTRGAACKPPQQQAIGPFHKEEGMQGVVLPRSSAPKGPLP